MAEELPQSRGAQQCHRGACLASTARCGLSARRPREGAHRHSRSPGRKAMLLNEAQDFIVSSHNGLRQFPQFAQNKRTPAQRSQGQFSNDEGMSDDVRSVKQVDEGLVAGPQVGRPRRTCRPGSRRFCPPPARLSQARLAAAQTRQAACAFALDQCFEGLTDEGRFLLEAGIGLGLGQQCPPQYLALTAVTMFRRRWPLVAFAGIGTRRYRELFPGMPVNLLPRTPADDISSISVRDTSCQGPSRGFTYSTRSHRRRHLRCLMPGGRLGAWRQEPPQCASVRRWRPGAF